MSLSKLLFLILIKVSINISLCRDIVDAAHLQPITKKDKNNAKTKNRLWNTSALDEDNNPVDD